MSDTANDKPDERHDENTAESRDPSLLQLETQPVPAHPTLPAYPTLPAAYTSDDDTTVAPAADSSPPTAPGPAPVQSEVQGQVVAPPMRRLPRVRTVTFGLVLLAISVLSLVAMLTDVRLDGGVVGLGLLIGAGAALLAGGIAAAVREARGGPGGAQ